MCSVCDMMNAVTGDSVHIKKFEINVILCRVSVGKTNAFLIQIFYPKDLSRDEMNVLIVINNQIFPAVTSQFQNKLKSDSVVIFMIKILGTGEHAHDIKMKERYCMKIHLRQNILKLIYYYLNYVVLKWFHFLRSSISSFNKTNVSNTNKKCEMKRIYEKDLFCDDTPPVVTSQSQNKQ